MIVAVAADRTEEARIICSCAMLEMYFCRRKQGRHSVCRCHVEMRQQRAMCRMSCSNYTSDRQLIAHSLIRVLLLALCSQIIDNFARELELRKLKCFLVPVCPTVGAAFWCNCWGCTSAAVGAPKRYSRPTNCPICKLMPLD